MSNKVEMLPCPFCGGTYGAIFVMTQGNKWGQVECGECGASGPDVRTDYDDSDNAEWHENAIQEWNKRK